MASLILHENSVCNLVTIHKILRVHRKSNRRQNRLRVSFFKPFLSSGTVQSVLGLIDVIELASRASLNSKVEGFYVVMKQSAYLLLLLLLLSVALEAVRRSST